MAFHISFQLKHLAFLLMLSGLIACSGGGKSPYDFVSNLGGPSGSSGSSSDSEGISEDQLKSGVFLDGIVSGLNYSSFAVEGVTDENGTFRYYPPVKVTFSVGEVVLGSSLGDDIITPLDLANSKTTLNATTTNIVRFLVSIDSDGDASNGIQIAEEAHELAKNLQSSVNFKVSIGEFEANETVLSLMASIAPAGGLVDVASARSHFLNTLNESTEADDSDGDGVVDYIDAFPDDDTESADSDEDGYGDNTDAFPTDPEEWLDTDGDGIGDNADTVDDSSPPDTNTPAQRPVAEAGESQSIMSGQTVTLDGSQSTSTNGDGTIVRYQWTYVSGPEISINNSTESSATFSAPDVEAESVVTVSLKVTDEFGIISLEDTVEITITPVPGGLVTANAGANQTANLGTFVGLDGAGSTGNIASYNWQQVSGIDVVVSDSAVAQTSFTAPSVEQRETIIFRLTVTNSEGFSDSDDVEITVSPTLDSGISANSGADQTVTEKDTVTLNGSNSIGPIQSYRWEQTGGRTVELSDSTATSVSFSAPLIVSDETYTFLLTVTDSEGGTSSDSVNVLVENFEMDCTTFDPDKVYLHGTFSEGAAYLDAVAEPERPYWSCVGFDRFVGGVVRPTDNSYVYFDLEAESILKFIEDEKTGLYPDKTVENDTVIETVSLAGCSTRNVLANPSTGALVYNCPNDTWFREGGTSIAAAENYAVFAVLSNNSLVGSSFDKVAVIGSTAVEINGTYNKIIAAKDSGNGLWFADSADGSSVTRYRLQGTTATAEGSYASLPSGVTVVNTAAGNQQTAIDGSGNLYQMGRLGSDDVIVKRPLSPGISEIIYTEADAPDDNSRGNFVFIHISALVTGP